MNMKHTRIDGDVGLRIELRHYLCLAILVITGGILRLYRIDLPGFTEGADYMYALTARTMSLILGWAWRNPGLLGDPESASQQLQQLFASLGHKQLDMPYSCKPLFDYVNAFLIGSIGYEEWVLPVSSAFAGIVSLGALFIVSARFYRPQVGLVAVALLCVSGGGLVFSRYGQSHMWSVALFIWGFWAYCHSIGGERPWRWLVLSAVLMGLTLALHPNMAPYVGTLALGELVLIARGQIDWRLLGKRAAIGVASLVGVALALNLPFIFIDYFGSTFFDEVRKQMSWPFLTYLEQLPHHFGQVFVGSLTPDFGGRFYTYVVVLWAWEGLPVTALVVLGFVLSVRHLARLPFFDLLLLGQIAIPLLFWLFSDNVAVYRFSAGALPSLMLVAARTLVQLSAHIAKRASLPQPYVAAVFCVLLMGYNLNAHRDLYQARSAYKLAADWLQRQGETRIAVHHSFTWHYYGIEPVDLVANLDEVRYIAFNRRYMSAVEMELLQVAGDPVKVFPHKRPGKLLEVNLVRNSVVLKLLEYLPGLGGIVTHMRDTVLSRNDLRRLEIYEIHSGRAKV